MEIKPFENGVSIRTSRIFNEKTGRCVAIAMDHGVSLGAVYGLERIGERLEEVIREKPEAVLVGPGTIRKYGYLLLGRGAPAPILAVDFPLFAIYPGGDKIDGQVTTISAEEAARLGAEMVKICMIFGQEKVGSEIQNFSYVAKTIEACHKIGLPVMVEPTTWGLRFEGKNIKDSKLLADMARIAYELGADIVKSDFPENPEDMKKISRACPVPIVLLGGGKSAKTENMLSDVHICIQNGAAGVTFGRNVWQHAAIHKIVKAIQKVVHEEDLPGALALLK
jgi:DhnA family fructose-bisphosphate aldolase class Ia